MNTAEASTLSTAEHALALMMSLARKIPAADAARAGGQLEERSQYQGTQLAGKTLGVVGLGRIGRTVAARALAMEMTVVGFDPFFVPPTALDGKVKLVRDFDEFLRQLDVVTFHVPGGDATQAPAQPRPADRRQVPAEPAGRQRQPGRGDRRVRAGRGDRAKEDRRGRPGRLRRRAAGQGPPAVRAGERRADAAPGGEHRRGPDRRQRRGVQGDRGLPRPRRDPRGRQRRRRAAGPAAGRGPVRRPGPPDGHAARQA